MALSDLREKFSNFDSGKILFWFLAIGLFVQISGKVWIESGSARNSQIYIWLLLPSLIIILWNAWKVKNFLPPVNYFIWGGFLLWVGISSLWSTGADGDFFSFFKRSFFVALYLAAIYFLMAWHPARLKKVLVVAFIIVALGSAISIIFQYGILHRPIAYRAYRLYSSGIREFADYGWPVAAGIFHGAVASWVLGLALDKRNSIKSTMFWLAVFLVLSLYVLFTFSRGAWFALCAAAFVAVLLQRSKVGWVLFSIGIVAFAVLLVMFWPQLVVEVEDKELSGRGLIWRYYFEVMPDHWLFGYGLGTPFTFHWPNGTSVSPHAHSLYLQQVYDSGLVSLVLLVSGIVSLFWGALKNSKDYWVRLAFPPLVFALVAMLTDVERIVTRPGDYWTVFWLPAAVLLAKITLSTKSKPAR